MSYPGGRGGLQDDPGFTMPPPNNAGTGGVGHVTWAASSGTPKKKSLTYNSIEVSYDYELKQLKVVNSGGEEINLDEEELNELRNALQAMGLSLVPPGNGVHYR